MPHERYLFAEFLFQGAPVKKTDQEIPVDEKLPSGRRSDLFVAERFNGLFSGQRPFQLSAIGRVTAGLRV